VAALAEVREIAPGNFRWWESWCAEISHATALLSWGKPRRW